MAANKTIVAIIVLALAAGVGYWALTKQGDNGAAHESDQDAKSEPAQAAEVPEAQAAQAAQAGVRPQTGLSVTPEDLARRYQCPGADVDCANSPNVASSAAEARWLVDHGYPTLEQIRDLSSKSTADYESEYRRTGSKVAQTLWALSLSTNDELTNAVGILGESIQTGNVFAYYVLSDIYMRSPHYANLTTSAGYMRAAYLAGDAKAGTMYQQKYSHLSPVEHSQADKNAYELFKNLGKGRNYPRP